ncbi:MULTISPECIES: methyltransferase regulatory domain-containing protein [unclassified Lysobacter]
MTTTVESVKRSYDETPYDSRPFPQSTPEHVAAVAHLFGLQTPAPDTARVLELGCAAGGNVVPFAARHPGAQVLGLDLSHVQIDCGQRVVDGLGLRNLELRQADLSTLEDDVGEFDYIICHGVYSWVPAHVQNAILQLCGQRLSPNGVAYVSYNTYPGWKGKEIVRDAMLLRGAERNTPADRLAYARGMIEFLGQMAHPDSVLARVVEENLPMLKNSQDYYLLHEFLEECNAPCYFGDFVERASGHGLSYLAEAEPAGMFVSNHGQGIAGPLLKECGDSQVKLEQYLDFVTNRQFRQTLLVPAERATEINYALSAERLQALHYAANLPCQDQVPSMDARPQRFGPSPGQSISLDGPAAKAAAGALTRVWPSTLSYPDLLSTVAARVDEPREQVRIQLDGLLESLVISGLARYRLSPVAVGGTTGDKPCIGIHARKAAALHDVAGGTFNAWHETVALDPVGQCLSPFLDGSHDRQALLKRLGDAVRKKRIQFVMNGRPVTGEAEQARCMEEHLDALLSYLPQTKLLLPIDG